MTRALTVLSIALSLHAHAADKVAQAGGFQVHQFGTRSSGIGTEDADFIEISPLNSSTTAREHRYQVLSTGQIGDFSAVNFKQVQAHTYFVLPNTKDVGFNTQTPGSLKVTTASGLLLTYKNGGLERISDSSGGSPCAFTKPFTIGACENRLVFDTGIGTSNGAYANFNGKTKITDPDGSSCSVSNAVVFERVPGRKTTADAQMKSVPALTKALRAIPECSKLNLALLSGGGAGSGDASSRAPGSRLDSVEKWIDSLPARSKSVK